MALGRVRSWSPAWALWLEAFLTLALIVAVCSPPAAQDFRGEAQVADDPVTKALCQWLLSGLPQDGNREPAQVQRRRKSTLELAPGDPRIDLCEGLILLGEQKTEVAAMAALDRARRAEGNLLAAAHRVYIRKKLSQLKFGDAATAMLDLARALSTPAADSLLPEEKVRTARWLGRIIEFYRQPGAKQRAAEPIRKASAGIEAVLSPELKAAYAGGVASLGEELAELRKGVDAEVDLLTEEARGQRDAALEKIFQGKDKVLDERGKLELTGEKLEEWRRATLAAVEREINLRLQLYQRTLLEYEYWKKKLASVDLGGDGISKDREKEEKAIRQVRLVQLEQQLKGWYAVGVRCESLYWQAKGQVASRSSKLGEFERQLTKIKQNLSDDVRPQERAARNKASALDKLETFVPLDLAAERDALLVQWQSAK